MKQQLFSLAHKSDQREQNQINKRPWWQHILTILIIAILHFLTSIGLVLLAFASTRSDFENGGSSSLGEQILQNIFQYLLIMHIAPITIFPRSWVSSNGNAFWALSSLFWACLLYIVGYWTWRAIRKNHSSAAESYAEQVVPSSELDNSEWPPKRPQVTP